MHKAVIHASLNESGVTALLSTLLERELGSSHQCTLRAYENAYDLLNSGHSPDLFVLLLNNMVFAPRGKSFALIVELLGNLKHRFPTPIIAMYGNLLDADEAEGVAQLKAGLVDELFPIPFEIPEFVQALKRHLPSSATA